MTKTATETRGRCNGCATLNPGEHNLWIVPSNDPINKTQGFSLAEIIEAGLHQKIVGLDAADLDAAIAGCVADIYEHINDLIRETAP